MKTDGKTSAVDFSRQCGIYILYYKDEIVYVGRTTDSLGSRLYAHTTDTYKRRDRFSWFGLVPVSPSGELGTPPNSYSYSKLVEALEAVLIEVLEPR